VLIEHIRELNRICDDLTRNGRVPEAVLLTVGASEAAVKASVGETHGSLIELALDNCPHQVVLCGTEESMVPAAEELRRQGIACEYLPFRRAYHTRLFEPVCRQLREFIRGLVISPLLIPAYSCATAQLYPEDPEEIRELSVAQWSRSVRFRETVEAMHRDGFRVFVEVGPRGNLSMFVNDILRRRPHVAVPVNLHNRSGITQLNHLVAILAAHHVPMCLDHLYTARSPRQISLQPNAERDEAHENDRSNTLALRLPILKLSSTWEAGGAGGSSPPSISIAGVAPNDPPALPLSSAAVDEPIHGRISTGHRSRSDPPTDPEEGVWPQVMDQYFATMDRFIDLQRDLTQAFLSRETAEPPGFATPCNPQVEHSQNDFHEASQKDEERVRGA
jgi:acyl transferase domain-containing protein